jgi:FkbM family methyltransferase
MAGPLVKTFLDRAVGPYAFDETEVVHTFLGKKRGVMLDVGAAFGLALEPFADDGWEVHAFEPDAVNRDRLVRAHGHRQNLTIVPKALSDTPGSLTFYKSAESPGISSLAPFRETHEPAGAVEVTTLKDYLDTSGIDRIDFLKIDVEGYERNVLAGYEWTPKAGVIELEFEDSKTVPLGYRWQDLADDLTARGYGVIVSEWYPIVSYGGTHRWRGFRPYPTELDDQAAWGNLIATDHDFDGLLATATRTARRYRTRRRLHRLRDRALRRRPASVD